MEKLAGILERFNRKERNLLVRAALGHAATTPLYLCDTFRKDVANATGIKEIPENAWWATDYHISWVAGALAVLVKGELAVFHRNDDPPLPPWPNPPVPNTATQPEEGQSQLVEGNQEDVDLVIATESDLIMVEAKGFGSFDKEQLQSKLQRLELLHTFYKDTLCPAGNRIRFRFLLISPKRPPDFDITWPEWVLKQNGTVPWIELKLGNRITVERCNLNHKRDANGGHWHVIGNKIAVL